MNMEFTPDTIVPKKTNDDRVAEWDENNRMGAMQGPRPKTSTEKIAEWGRQSENGVMGGPRPLSNEEERAEQNNLQLEKDISPEMFKEKVLFLARMISGWSKKMDLESYTRLLEVEKIAGREGHFLSCVLKAIRAPKGIYNAGDLHLVSNLKSELDSFESHIDKYINEVSNYASQANMSNSFIVDRLQDLEKELSGWNHDE